MVKKILDKLILEIKCFIHTDNKFKYNIICITILFLIRVIYHIRYGVCLSGFGFDLSEVKPEILMEHNLLNVANERNVEVLIPNKKMERTLCGDGYFLNKEKTKVDYSVELKAFNINKKDKQIPLLNEVLINRLIYCHTNETIFGYINPDHGNIMKDVIEQYNEIYDKRLELFNRIKSTETSGYFFNKFKKHFLKVNSNEIKGMNEKDIEKLIEDAFNKKLKLVSDLIDKYKITGNTIYRQNADYELLSFTSNKESYKNRIF